MDKRIIEGTIVEQLGGKLYRMQVAGLETPLKAYLSGKMYKARINVLIGDRVRAEFVSDLSNGRIVRRLD